MKKIIIIFLVTFVSSSFIACQHIETIAQDAARAELIDPGTANWISFSARAFSDAAAEITPDQEYYIGRAVAANILNNYKIWNGDPALTSYLNLICAAIVLNSPQPSLFNGYYLAILDTGEINAFATSGGHIFVTRGLINVARTEDALAGVIAHEIAHIQLRHGMKSITSNRITQAFMDTATMGVGNAMGLGPEEMSNILDESVNEIMLTMVNRGYSPEQEYEADTAAMYFMAFAGYQPTGLIDMLKELDKVQSTARLKFNRTHPAPVQRIYFAEQALKRFRIADTVKNRQERFNKALHIE